jgi:hypothetical protein
MSICHSSRLSSLTIEMPGGRCSFICTQWTLESCGYGDAAVSCDLGNKVQYDGREV